MVIGGALAAHQCQVWNLCVSFLFNSLSQNNYCCSSHHSHLCSSKGEGGKWKACGLPLQLFISLFKALAVSHNQDFVVKEEGVIRY